MSRKTTSAIAALLCMVLAGPAVAKPFCYTQQDVHAMQVRQLHYELMVAALKCQGGEVNFHDKWSNWVGRFGSTMNSNANQLRGMFNRLGKGQAGMDRFVTQLSNDASMRSQHVEDYCATQAKLFDTVLVLSPSDMESWAASTVEKPMNVSTSCTAAKPAPVQEAKVISAQKPQSEKRKAEKAKANGTVADKS